MDKAARIAHLQAILKDNEALLERLRSHEQKLLAHHESKERGHALKHARGSIARGEKTQRRLERALRNEQK